MTSNKSESFLWRKFPTSSYYFRCIVPFDLVPTLGISRFHVSLRTGILQESKRLSRNLYCFTQELFSDIRCNRCINEISIDEIKTQLKNELERLTTNDDMAEWSKQQLESFINQRIQDFREDTFFFETELRSEKKQNKRESDLERFINRVEQEFSQGNFNYAEKKLQEDIEKFNLDIEKDSRVYRFLLSITKTFFSNQSSSVEMSEKESSKMNMMWSVISFKVLKHYHHNHKSFNNQSQQNRVIQSVI